MCELLFRLPEELTAASPLRYDSYCDVVGADHSLSNLRRVNEAIIGVDLRVPHTQSSRTDKVTPRSTTSTPRDN
jgi:hypothetical protein